MTEQFYVYDVQNVKLTGMGVYTTYDDALTEAKRLVVAENRPFDVLKLTAHCAPPDVNSVTVTELP